MNFTKSSYQEVLERHQRLGILRRGLYILGVAATLFAVYVVLGIMLDDSVRDGARLAALLFALSLAFPAAVMARRAITGKR